VGVVTRDEDLGLSPAWHQLRLAEGCRLFVCCRVLAAFHCTPTPATPDRRFDGLAHTAAAFFDMCVHLWTLPCTPACR
jgi:hypothetical protein